MNLLCKDFLVYTFSIAIISWGLCVICTTSVKSSAITRQNRKESSKQRAKKAEKERQYAIRQEKKKVKHRGR